MSLANMLNRKPKVAREAAAFDVEEQISRYFCTVTTTIAQVDKSAMIAAFQAILACYEQEGTIYLFGNGGSAATASHFCGDMNKTFGHDLPKRFYAQCLSDNVPQMMAISNDISYLDIFLEPLRGRLTSRDLCVGISGSGNSPNIVKALEYARLQKATTLAVCGFNGGKIKNIADISLHANVADMEAAEDAHLCILHCLKRLLCLHFYGEQIAPA